VVNDLLSDRRASSKTACDLRFGETIAEGPQAARALLANSRGEAITEIERGGVHAFRPIANVDQHRLAPLRQPVISLSHGIEWKALITRYIGTIPLNGDASCVAEHSTSGTPPSWSPVRSAMIAKVGAAARDSKQSASALGRSRCCPTLGETKRVVLEIISRRLSLSHRPRHAFSNSS
jgi:hypothetical protein